MGIRNSLFLNREALADALHRPSSWVLIAANLGLIAGVIAWGWSIFDIVFLYWVENLVIGAINVLKMIFANPEDESLTALADKINTQPNPQTGEEIPKQVATRSLKTAGKAFKLFLIPFFIIHYGAFCFGHGVFVFSMFSDGSLTGGDQDTVTAVDMLSTTMIFAISLLGVSHLFSFLRNYIGAGEYKRTHASSLMGRPYGRIVALHITIILGAMLSMALGSPMGLLIVLIILKTLVDLAMHQSERNKLQGIY